MLTDLIKGAMKEEGVTVRSLAEKAGLSPTIVQGLRTGKRDGVSLKSFLKIMQALGCDFIAKKGDNQYRIGKSH